MPLARSEHAVAEFDGKIWVLGGYPPGRLPSNLVQIYDPATGRWSLGPRLPQPMHHTTVKAVNGKLYVMGGEIDGASTGRPEKYVRTSGFTIRRSAAGSSVRQCQPRGAAAVRR